MEMKNYHFGVKLQSRELNLVLRKTAMIVREVPFATRSIPLKVRISLSTVRISKFFEVFQSICSTSMKIQ